MSLWNVDGSTATMHCTMYVPRQSRNNSRLQRRLDLYFLTTVDLDLVSFTLASSRRETWVFV